jgi:hypothetical protein
MASKVAPALPLPHDLRLYRSAPVLRHVDLDLPGRLVSTVFDLVPLRTLSDPVPPGSCFSLGSAWGVTVGVAVGPFPQAARPNRTATLTASGSPQVHAAGSSAARDQGVGIL